MAYIYSQGRQEHGICFAFEARCWQEVITESFVLRRAYRQVSKRRFPWIPLRKWLLTPELQRQTRGQ